jgi:hypothetical protein
LRSSPEREQIGADYGDDGKALYEISGPEADFPSVNGMVISLASDFDFGFL